MKRSQIWSVALPGLALFVPVESLANGAAQQLPDIVFILADDMGYGDVSCLNSDGKINTPNIDRMAEKGVVFTNAHSLSAVCTPTRYGLLTGQYSWRTTLKQGVLDGYSRAMIDGNRTTIASMLSQQGYQTACIGKWHLGWDWTNIEKGRENVDFSRPITNGPVTRGFDYFYGFSASLDMPPYVYVENDRPTAPPNRETEGNSIPAGNPGYDGAFWRKGPTGSDFDVPGCLPNITSRALNYIDRHAPSSQPYFLYLPLPAPHTPILPDSSHKGKSGINAYADFVMMVDGIVGQVINALERNGTINNTLLVFTSDNGCAPWADLATLMKAGHNPNYIFRGHKADLYEGGHHIPCLVQWPGKIKKPRQVSQTICLNDFMATFADISGYRLKNNEAEDSFSFLPALLDLPSIRPVRKSIIHHSVNGSFAITKGAWKLLMAAGSGGWSFPRPGREEAGLPAVQLYNLDEDQGETVNLQEKYPEKVLELRTLLLKIISDGRSTPGIPQKNSGNFNGEKMKWE